MTKGKEDKLVTDKNLVAKNQYTVLWYDAKMVNYLNLLKFLIERKIVQAKVVSYLVVDRRDVAENVEKIKEEATDAQLKSQVKLLLKRDLTE